METSSTSAGAAAITEQLEERFKRVVTDLNLGDQLSVILIACLTLIILTAPFVIRQMKQSDTVDYEVTSEDPVDELTKSFRRAIHSREEMKEGEESDEEDSKGALEFLVKDILKSKGLQQAAQKFLISILESPEFQVALQRLVKQLWGELVNDPETIAQVIRLLQIAIQDPQVKKAAQQLVLDLVRDDEVKAALIEMVQKLGVEPQVRSATQELLKEAAHGTLNDPEVLDHSMEFATDVVGDDLVQRTAGEALRKSVGHAVRPATLIVLTATGVGLFIFGIVATGYARSSDKEAVMLESVARSLQTNATYGIVRMVTWPGRAIQTLWEHGKLIAFLPVEWLHNSLGFLGNKTSALIVNGLSYVLALPGRGVDALFQSTLSMARSAGMAVTGTIEGTVRGSAAAVASCSATLLANIAVLLQQAFNGFVAAMEKILRSSFTSVLSATTAISSKLSRVIAAGDKKILDFYERIMAILEALLQQFRPSSDRFYRR